MSADGPDSDLYERRTVRRLRVIAITFAVGYAVSAASLYPLCWHLVGVFGYLAPMTTAGFSAFLPAVGLAIVAHRAHKSFWPEHPDDEE